MSDPIVPTRFNGPATRSRRGQSLVEFALVLPLMLLLVCGTVDLGRAFLSWVQLTNVARAAARVATFDQHIPTIQNAAAGQTVRGFNPADVQVSFRYADDPDDPLNTCMPIALGCVAVVTVPYIFEPAFPMISNIVGTITMSSTSTSRIQSVNP